MPPGPHGALLPVLTLEDPSSPSSLGEIQYQQFLPFLVSDSEDERAHAAFQVLPPPLLPIFTPSLLLPLFTPHIAAHLHIAD